MSTGVRHPHFRVTPHSPSLSADVVSADNVGHYFGVIFLSTDMLVICQGTDIVKSVAKMTTNIALSLWLNMMHVGVGQLHVHGSGFNPKSG